MNQISPRIARLKARQMIEYMIKSGYWFDKWDWKFLVEKKIFTREEIQVYRRRDAIEEKLWWHEVSPLREARKFLRSGIPAALIHQYADALARRHPFDMYHEHYTEKIREEIEPLWTRDCLQQIIDDLHGIEFPPFAKETR